MSDKPKITDEELRKGAENLSKVSEEELARIKAEKEKRAEELAKVKAALEKASQ